MVTTINFEKSCVRELIGVASCWLGSQFNSKKNLVRATLWYALHLWYHHAESNNYEFKIGPFSIPGHWEQNASQNEKLANSSIYVLNNVQKVQLWTPRLQITQTYSCFIPWWTCTMIWGCLNTSCILPKKANPISMRMITSLLIVL